MVEGNATSIEAVAVNDAMCLELFTLKPIFDKQILKKIFGVSNKKSIFAATNPTTPLNDAYHGGTSLFIKGI